MNVYYFGNIDQNLDNAIFKYVKKLQNDLPGINFIEVKPNQDLFGESDSNLLIFDAVQGITQPRIFDETQIDQIVGLSRATVHDYDLGFQLKYLKKLGKISKVTIVGIPMTLAKTTSQDDYSLIHSIFKKLVAQDIHGS